MQRQLLLFVFCKARVRVAGFRGIHLIENKVRKLRRSIEFMSAVFVLLLRSEELDAAHPYRFVRRFTGICSLPQSPPWAATCICWRSLLIGLTEIWVFFGSHPCWQ